MPPYLDVVDILEVVDLIFSRSMPTRSGTAAHIEAYFGVLSLSIELIWCHLCLFFYSGGPLSLKESHYIF